MENNRMVVLVRAADGPAMDRLRSEVYGLSCCDVEPRYRIFVVKRSSDLEVSLNVTQDGVDALRSIPGLEIFRTLEKTSL